MVQEVRKSPIRYSTIYLNRECPRKCPFCAERYAPLSGTRLSGERWLDAIHHLDNLGVKFHLILGNEPLIMGQEFVDFIAGMKGRQDYGVYSTFPKELARRWCPELLKAGIYDMAIGLDTLDPKSPTAEKCQEALIGLITMKKLGLPDAQITITINRQNLKEIPQMVQLATDEGIHIALNLIHWNTDGGFDFFPEELPEYSLRGVEAAFASMMRWCKKETKSGRVLIQNYPEYFDEAIKYGRNYDWHCSIPAIITVDADGSLRACAYRKGTRLTQHNIFEVGTEVLPLEEYFQLWQQDVDDCPGCFYTWHCSVEHWLKTDPEFGDRVWQVHASKYHQRWTGGVL